MTQLMVITGHQLKIHGADEPESEFENIEYDTEEQEDGRLELDLLAEDILYLEETVDNDRQRMTQFIKRVDVEVAEENMEIMQLSREMQKLHAELSKSDDLEDQAAAEETRKQMEDDYDIDMEEEDDDAPSRHSDAEEDEIDDGSADLARERRERRALMKHIYKLITIKTHPDKCGNTSKLNYYRDAVKCYNRDNLHGLQTIYKKVYGHEYGKSSLFDRIDAARKRRDQLRMELDDIRSTGAWQLYQVSVETDFPRAINILRENLRMQIQGMRVMLSQMQEKRNWM